LKVQINLTVEFPFTGKVAKVRATLLKQQTDLKYVVTVIQRIQPRKISVTLCEPSTTVFISGTDRTNVCWVKEGCSSLKPAACSSLPLEVVDHVDKFDAEKLNLHLNKGCYTDEKKPLQAQLDNAPASCNPPCFRITKPGEYCYMGTRNNNFSNRRHVGQITVTEASDSVAE